MLKLQSLKYCYHSINSRNYAIDYHQTLEGTPRTLAPDKNDTKIQKDSENLKKIAKDFPKKADIKDLKNIPSHLKAMQYSII